MDASIIKNYFPQISSLQYEQFGMLSKLYAEWNLMINVISRKDIDNIYVHHVLHSLGIAKVIQFKPGTSILDVGTGGGFPGIPLAIMFPQINFHLVDSIGKKITVVKAIAEACELKNVITEQARAESLKDRYDFIVSRAVTRLKPFYQWVQNKVRAESFNTLDNGILCLKGGDLEEELAELKKPHSVYMLSDYFKEDFFETKKIVYVPIIV